MSKRINYLDVARGVAILGVVLGHIKGISMNQGVQFIYSFNMPVFFIISGMLFFYNQKWRNQSLSSIAIKKIQTLMYPYITFSILSMLIEVALNEPFMSIKRDIIYTISGYGILTLWFLPALFGAE